MPDTSGAVVGGVERLKKVSATEPTLEIGGDSRSQAVGVVARRCCRDGGVAVEAAELDGSRRLATKGHHGWWGGIAKNEI